MLPHVVVLEVDAPAASSSMTSRALCAAAWCSAVAPPGPVASMPPYRSRSASRRPASATSAMAASVRSPSEVDEQGGSPSTHRTGASTGAAAATEAATSSARASSLTQRPLPWKLSARSMAAAGRQTKSRWSSMQPHDVHRRSSPGVFDSSAGG